MFDNFNYPAGADADSNAPWHENDTQIEEIAIVAEAGIALVKTIHSAREVEVYYEQDEDGNVEQHTTKIDMSDKEIYDNAGDSFERSIEIAKSAIDKLKDTIQDVLKRDSLVSCYWNDLTLAINDLSKWKLEDVNLVDEVPD